MEQQTNDSDATYTPEHGIGWAVRLLQGGARVTRTGWNGPGQRLELQVPDEHSWMPRPYVYITTVQADRVPWLASQADLLATDWKLAA